MAADRAAELTEAYRILSDAGRRADYDRAFAEGGLHAAKWAGADEACVLLMGTSLAPAGELATAIGDQRKKYGNAGGGKLVLIPVDARDWEARMPLDAPPIAKTLLARLRSGT